MRFESGFEIDYSSGFGAVANWAEALHGHGQLTTVLDRLRAVSNSDVSVLLRFTPGNPVAKKIAIADPSANSLISRSRVTFAHDVFGDYLDVMKDGAFILYSELVREGAITMSEQIHTNRILSQNAISDIGVIRLSSEDKHSDYLEFYSSSEIRQKDAALLTALGTTLASSWMARLPGTAHEAYLQTRAKPTRILQREKVVAALDASNPLGLTRCEFRVCTLIREGPMAKSIAEALGVKVSTVRSHMHSIYLKAGVGGHVELLHMLKSDPVAEPARKAS